MELELLAAFLRREQQARWRQPAMAALFARDESGHRLLETLRPKGAPGAVEVTA